MRALTLLASACIALPAAAQSGGGPRTAEAAYQLGRAALKNNDVDEAVQQLERAVQLDDNNATYHTWLGNALRESIQRASKIRQPFIARRLKNEWSSALELDPNQIDARAGLVQLYAFAPSALGGSKDKARAQAEEISKRNPMRGAIARGTIAESEKNPVAEIAAYEQAIAAAPDSGEGYMSLGSVYSRDGKAEEAFAIVDAYAKRRPDDHWSLYYVGRFAGMTGQQLDRGEESLKQFLKSPPLDAPVLNLAGAHYWLGRIAEKRGAKDTAREQYEAALKINPRSQGAQRALDAMK